MFLLFQIYLKSDLPAKLFNIKQKPRSTYSASGESRNSKHNNENVECKKYDFEIQPIT